MLMLILFSSLVGIIMREWYGRRPRTKAVITLAMLVLVVAVLLLAYGNYLGDQADKSAIPPVKDDVPSQQISQ
jgi:L-rhamnose-H+ transport protein